MDSNNMTVSLFSRALALIYAIAFLSFGVQAAGLIGSAGILPAGAFLNAVHRPLGAVAYWRVPTVLWLAPSDFALQAVCWGGALVAVAALFVPAHGILQRAALALLYVLYLSLVSVGQVFMGYQWDALLLETGFLAIFLTPGRLRLWLFHWLLFRLMFESGVSKLLSHDPTWKDLTALTFHWHTQPLPTPFAWVIDQAPLWFQKASCALVLLVEVLFPFLIFGPRQAKAIAAVGILLLQFLILLTGNYTFFNLLTIALCLPLVAVPASSRANNRVSLILLAFTGILGLLQLGAMFGYPFAEPIRARISQFELVNEYGLFATMTVKRDEISIEGSNDAEKWQPYVFRYKPEALDRRGTWVAPHQPRLDWQMWFAALEDPQRTQWFQSFIFRLLQGSPPVLALLEHDPFPGHPPRYIRALVYEYNMTPTGWRRELHGMYFPPVRLQ